MKLAEALQERADLNARISNLDTRLQNNALVQEGERPAEDPLELIQELDACYVRSEQLIADINRTNSETIIDGKTLTQLLAHRDILTWKLASYRNLVNRASQQISRARNSEIRILSAVDVRALQKQIDQMSKELRLTDNAIQAANWQTDLIED